MAINGVQFDTDESWQKNDFHIRSRKILGEPTTPTMINLVMKLGLAKSEKQAMVILIIFIIIMVGLTLFLIKRGPREDIIVTADGRIIPIQVYIDSLDNGVDLLKR